MAARFSSHLFTWLKRSSILALSLFIVVLIVRRTQATSTKQLDKRDQSQAFSIGKPIATIESEELNEASGLVHSRSNSHYFWSHNDSGGKPVLFLISEEGANAAQFNLKGATNIDWEDIAIGPGPKDSISYLYVGDIGDNRAVRKTYEIYRTPEPHLQGHDVQPRGSLSDIAMISYVYEDGARDAEALLVDPQTADIYIISKREENVGIYKLPFPQNLNTLNIAKKVATLPLTQITAGEISFNGREILLKNYLNIYRWVRQGNQTVLEMFESEPERLAYKTEPQGEAIAWHTNGKSFYTISEKASADSVVLYEYTRN